MEIKKYIQDELEIVLNTLLEKNRSYGNSYFETRNEFGNVAFIIRLIDKVNRLKTLHKYNIDSYFESYQDTIRDIIGYCLLELIHNKITFTEDYHDK